MVHDMKGITKSRIGSNQHLCHEPFVFRDDYRQDSAAPGLCALRVVACSALFPPTAKQAASGERLAASDKRLAASGERPAASDQRLAASG